MTKITYCPFMSHRAVNDLAFCIEEDCGCWCKERKSCGLIAVQPTLVIEPSFISQFDTAFTEARR